MNIKKELIKREIAGESFLIPVGRTVYDANGLYALTEVGAFRTSEEASSFLRAISQP